MHKIIAEDVANICGELLPWESLFNKRILITGANGFLASYIVYTLLECNKRYGTNIMIYALCRDIKKARQRFQENEQLVLIHQDVMEDICDAYRSDIIFHAASPSLQYVNEKYPYLSIEANIIGFDKLLRKSEEWETETIMVFSSSAVYGHKTPRAGADETYRCNMDFTDYKNVYGLSKRMCETIANCWTKTKDCEIKTIRPFFVYGPGDNYTGKKSMTDFIKNCLCSEDIVIKSSGEVLRSYVYIRDAIKAVFYVLFKGEKNEAYNIASEKNTCNIRDLAHLFCEFNDKIKVICKTDGEKKNSILSGRSDKLKALGWKDETLLRDGLSRTLLWASDSDFLMNIVH